ncbi:uncharacterized protein K02A2.6-like [Armigeres subalbatus]|uniref:uncharacterized protein K02A2.6-like n=1 Tax=Armigeres subalbatus TaxID=124917 RepID=UPI002ED3CB3C
MYGPENGVRYEDLFHEDAKNLDEAPKVRLLLRNIGAVAHQKYISYILPKKPKYQNFDQTVSILKTIFGRQISVFNARYQCLQLSKNSSDDVYTYAGIVNQKCEEFKLNEVTPDQFKCLMYVCGLKSHRDADIRTTLLSQRLINLKRDTAMVEKHSSTEQSVCAITRTNPSRFTSSDEPNDVPRSPCWRCGEMHYSKHCFFVNHECHTCKKIGHKEGYCACFEKPIKKQKDKRFKQKFQAQGVFTVNQVELSDRRKYVTVEINGVPIKLQLDCASDITIIPEDVYVQLGSPVAKVPSIDAVNASGEEVGLILPYASASKIEVVLDRLQKLGIIIPVSYSEWAAPIVAVTKTNGRVRICADYSTGLNSALEPHQHPLPLPQDIFAKLANKKVFSQIDLSDAYLQVEIDQDSQKLLTINTHKGLLEFTRLSPGVKTAPGAFQEIVDNMIAGLDGVSGYLDDIIVASDSVEKHMIHLERLFARIREYGFTLKIEKSNFFMSEIKYLVLIVDSQGIRPDPEKVRAFSEMPAPHGVTTLRSFLGAVNYYSKFVRGDDDDDDDTIIYCSKGTCQ